MACSFSDIESDASDYSDLECVGKHNNDSENEEYTETNGNDHGNIKINTDTKKISAIEPVQNETQGDKPDSNRNSTQKEYGAESISEFDGSEMDEEDSDSDFDASSIISYSIDSSKDTKTMKSANRTPKNKKKRNRPDWRKYYKRKTPIMVLPCLICTETFNAHTKWKEHMNKTHNIERPYLCKLCLPDNICYASKYGLDAHIQRDHENVRNWKCEHCPKAFFKKRTLAKHQRVHDGKRPYQCPECEQSFTQKSSMSQHIKTVHRKERNHICSYCKQGFPSSTSMKSHMVAKHNDADYARYECDICHKRYYHQQGYRKHLESGHRPVDPIKAMIKRGECFYEGCGKKYTSKNCIESVKYHLVHTHADRRYANYECKSCDKLFYDKTRYRENLEMNIITKSDSSHSQSERQDQWDSDLNPEINETETNKDSPTDLDNSSVISLESKSQPISPNQSTANNNKKKKRAEWRKFYKRKTPILVLPCLICTETFNAHTKWREHMNKTHNIERPYLCKLCLPDNICYASKYGLDAHIQRDHENVRNWKCEHCPKAFFKKRTLAKHQRVHDGKRPYQCPECEQSFTQKSSMSQHIKTVHRKERNHIVNEDDDIVPSRDLRLLYINDIRANIFNPQATDEDIRSQNVAFVECKVYGWVYVFVITIQAIKAGEELLIDYGESYSILMKENKRWTDIVEAHKQTVMKHIVAMGKDLSTNNKPYQIDD